ncbi:DUF2189 domain-containing protein [Citreimonas salinaria]|uniref:Uncharacterized membrane protein n=1 Tax=Citreimonas salinaria TaxID=321339 RepID=A0A1H3NT07_9RHOB|nr:DUF2189 domain-containing protein [Citreimonas salinaria]SDY91309.1 Uncharacterized membrane protein [Citreimonas salinaria]
MDTDSAIPKVVPPLPRPNPKARGLPKRTAFEWLGRGWSDFRTNPVPSLCYGLAVFLVSAFVVWGMFRYEVDYFFLPALSGFLVLGPLIATGLYEKTRRLEEGKRTTLGGMVFVKPASTYQAVFLGLLLLLLFMLWQRAAFLLYALHMGVRPFPGFDQILQLIFTTWIGWSLLITGTFIGGLFAAFAFAIGVFAAPMMLEERTDALTAMGISLALVWNNLGVMLAWGGIVVALFALSLLTGLLGLVVIFPVLGHATWHSYRAIRISRGEKVFYAEA